MNIGEDAICEIRKNSNVYDEYLGFYETHLNRLVGLILDSYANVTAGPDNGDHITSHNSGSGAGLDDTHMNKLQKYFIYYRFQIYDFLESLDRSDVESMILRTLLKLKIHKIGNQLNKLNGFILGILDEKPLIDLDDFQVMSHEIKSPKPVSLVRLIEPLKSAGVSVEVEVANGDGSLFDPGSMHNPTECTAVLHPEIFTELLAEFIRNAKYADASTISISLSDLQDGYKLLIADDGKGIPKVYLDKVFDENFTTRVGGTGTGLFAAKNYIEQFLGGTITVDSYSKLDEILDEGDSGIKSGTVVKVLIPKA